MTKEQFLRYCERQENGCLYWKGKTAGDGYGEVILNGKRIRAHRFALHLWTGFDLDSPLLALHNDDICTSRKCCEYTHLRSGTHSDNTATAKIRRNDRARKSHCVNGHEFTESNTYINYKGHRSCIICRKKNFKSYYKKLRR